MNMSFLRCLLNCPPCSTWAGLLRIVISGNCDGIEIKGKYTLQQSLCMPHRMLTSSMSSVSAVECQRSSWADDTDMYKDLLLLHDYDVDRNVVHCHQVWSILISKQIYGVNDAIKAFCCRRHAGCQRDSSILIGWGSSFSLTWILRVQTQLLPQIQIKQARGSHAMSSEKDSQKRWETSVPCIHWNSLRPIAWLIWKGMCNFFAQPKDGCHIYIRENITLDEPWCSISPKKRALSFSHSDQQSRTQHRCCFLCVWVRLLHLHLHASSCKVWMQVELWKRSENMMHRPQ